MERSETKERILVSACLAGGRSRYRGNQKLRINLLKRLKGYAIIHVCPEQLGGMPTPRSRASLSGGNSVDVLEGRARAIDGEGNDVTPSFIKGAKEALKIARLNGIQPVYLKEGSPSCGTKQCMRKDGAPQAKPVVPPLKYPPTPACA